MLSGVSGLSGVPLACSTICTPPLRSSPRRIFPFIGKATTAAMTMTATTTISRHLSLFSIYMRLLTKKTEWTTIKPSSP